MVNRYYFFFSNSTIRSHRKSLNNAFKFQQILSLIPVFVSASEKLVEIFENSFSSSTGKSKPINVLPILKDFAFDIIGIIIIPKSSNHDYFVFTLIYVPTTFTLLRTCKIWL